MNAAPAVGFAHFLSQIDAVGSTILFLLLVMSVATWYLIATKTLAAFRMRRRTRNFLGIFWNSPSLKAVEKHLEDKHPDEPFSHLAYHAIVAARHHQRHGADKLNEFRAGAGNEWNAQQDLGTGRVAMTIDGEWRNAFVPADLNYDSAPLPVAPGTEDRYGGGAAGGTVLALPKGSPHPAEGWLLLKWLATDTDVLVDVANRINNVPTTTG